MSQQLLFIFSHSPDDSLATDAWDAAMTAGLLNQSVTILFSGEGLNQLGDSAMMTKIESLQDIFPLRLCAEIGGLPSKSFPSQPCPPQRTTTHLTEAIEEISTANLASFTAQFGHILSF